MATKKTEPDVVAYVTHVDVQTVVRRIPEQYRLRLRDVFISDRSLGVRQLGSIRTRGRRDIDLYAVLPFRVSLGRFLGKWQSLNKKQRFMMVDLALSAPHARMPDLTQFGDINDSQMRFLKRALCLSVLRAATPVERGVKALIASLLRVFPS